MTATDEFRERAQQLLIELEAATDEMMKLVSEHQLSGSEWERVSQRQHEAHERWMTHLNEPDLDPGDQNASR